MAKERMIITGVGAGWAGWEITMYGKTLLRLSGQNFYVTGRPQPGMWKPPSGSTSSLFIYKAANPNKVFRLDYHALESTKGVPAWHYNTTGGFAQIRGLSGTAPQIAHIPTPRAATIGRTLTIFRWGGRALFFASVASSVFDVYHAESKGREIARQAGGLAGAMALGRAGASAGIKAGGAIAAGLGQAGPQVATPEELVTVPAGVIIGGIIGGVGGGIVGSIAGTTITETVYDWIFESLEKEEWIIL